MKLPVRVYLDSGTIDWSGGDDGQAAGVGAGLAARRPVSPESGAEAASHAAGRGLPPVYCPDGPIPPPASPRRMRPTLALLLDNLFDSYEELLFSGVRDAAAERDVNLFCFVGGAFVPRTKERGYVGKNLVYDLLPGCAVDALVLLTAPLGIFVDDGVLKMDLGRAGVVALPPEETERRWQETTPQWPIMHAVMYGVTRDQFMARHKANHIQVVYANSPKEADAALLAKAAMADAMGIDVSLCGTRKNGKGWD